MQQNANKTIEYRGESNSFEVTEDMPNWDKKTKLGQEITDIEFIERMDIVSKITIQNLEILIDLILNNHKYWEFIENKLIDIDTTDTLKTIINLRFIAKYIINWLFPKYVVTSYFQNINNQRYRNTHTHTHTPYIHTNIHTYTHTNKNTKMQT